MAQRHWLDPLARQLLIATGQLPRQGAAPAAGPGMPAPAARVASLVGSLAWGRSAAPPAAEPAPQTASSVEQERQEAIERDLLALQLAQQPGRRLRSAEEVQRAAALGWRLDVNRATACDWLRLPGCSVEQADLLQRLQAGGVQLSGPEDLQRLLQIDPAQLRGWLPLLDFRWYGSPPPIAAPSIAVNGAAAVELCRLEGVEGKTLARLLQERSRRPFRDLADLQERLALPAAVIEAWIGRVSFEPPPPGLPPSGPRLPRPSRGPSR